MRTMFSTWLLGGALAASLFWNFRRTLEPEPPTPAPSTTSCEIDPACLQLTGEQERALSRGYRSSCAEAERLATRAGELQAELYARLADPELDLARLRELAAEVAELRRLSLVACIDSVVGVRELLGVEQVAELLSACRAGCRKTD